MTQAISIFSPIDKDAERRRALGKVYRLLLRLAEEAENQALSSDTSGKEEKYGESAPAGTDPVDKEITVDLNTELLNSDFQQESNSVPLQNNIPPEV